MKSQCERLAENVQHIDVHQMQSQNGPETDSLINSTMPTPGLARDKKAGHLGMWAASKTLTKRFMQIVNCSRESQNAVRERVARMVTKVKCRESSAKKKPKEFWRCKSYEGNQVPSQKPKSRPARVAAKETKHVGGKARGLLKLLMWGEGTEAMPTCSCCICVFWSYEMHQIIPSILSMPRAKSPQADATWDATCIEQTQVTAERAPGAEPPAAPMPLQNSAVSDRRRQNIGLVTTKE